jgi:hypothetical protein
VVLVDDVPSAATKLMTRYPSLYPDRWRSDWAAFRIEGSLQVDIVVTRPGSEGDAHHRRAWELLARDRALLDEYRQIRDESLSDDDYARRKKEFFDRVVRSLDDAP